LYCIVFNENFAHLINRNNVTYKLVYKEYQSSFIFK